MSNVTGSIAIKQAGTTWSVDRFNLEEIIQVYNSLTEETDDIHWKKGELLSRLMSYGDIKLSWLSSQTGDSPAQLRELKKTYEAFEDASMRIPMLSWYHHRIAAGTDSPNYWIQYAAEKNLSTRELKEAIKFAKGQILSENEKLEKDADAIMDKIEHICLKNMKIGRALLCDIIDYARDLGVS